MISHIDLSHKNIFNLKEFLIMNNTIIRSRQNEKEVSDWTRACLEKYKNGYTEHVPYGTGHIYAINGRRAYATVDNELICGDSELVEILFTLEIISIQKIHFTSLTEYLRNIFHFNMSVEISYDPEKFDINSMDRISHFIFVHNEIEPKNFDMVKFKHNGHIVELWVDPKNNSKVYYGTGSVTDTNYYIEKYVKTPNNESELSLPCIIGPQAYCKYRHIYPEEITVFQEKDDNSYDELIKFADTEIKELCSNNKK